MQSPGGLERLLQALGCDTSKHGGTTTFDSEHGHIHCPTPHHVDPGPSCSVLVDKGLFYCHGACKSTILPMDLVIAHGHASTRAEAARWIEDALGIDASAPAAPALTIVEDPSLSVSQYLAMKRLSAATASRFGLVDARIWMDPERGKKGYKQTFEKGWHGCVLMPNDSPGTPLADLANRPRVRNFFGGRWPAKVVDLLGNKVDFARASETSPATELAYPQHAYGIPQFCPSADPMMQRTIILVEGESDVHALHDMGIANCLGFPGAGGAAASVPSIIGAILAVEYGDTAQLSSWSLLTWAEPDDTGQSMPDAVAKTVDRYALELDARAPRCAALQHSSIVVDGETAKDPCDLLALVANLHNGSLSPAREEAGRLITQAAFTALGQHAGELDPDAPAPAMAPHAAKIPTPTSMQRGSDPWEAMGCDGSLPAPDALPTHIRILSAHFERVEKGWLEHYTNAKEQELTRYVATIFDVAEIALVAGEEYVTLRAPRAPGDSAPELATTRILRCDVADSRVALRALASIGVTVTPRCGPQAVTLVSALAERELRLNGASRIAATTGWLGKGGLGLFAGIECDTSAELGNQMFRANERRRKMRPDTAVAAREWWDACAAPLLSMPDDPAPRHAAPLLALGAAAAAPLLGPLTELGIGISPVIWMAGMGGGGKSITQDACSAIFAPSYADLDGRAAFATGSNVSIAALDARADSIQDLPIVLDDISRLPHSSNAKLTGEAATIYAGAELGMTLFNRDRAQRATQEGKVRRGTDFRSTAIFSTELEMGASSSRSVVKAGHFRRITALDAQPMMDRGLGREYAEAVKRAIGTVGGAPGEMLVAHARNLVEADQIEALLCGCRAAIEALPGSGEVDLTQRESITISMAGFVALASSLEVMSEAEAIVMFASMVAPYFAVGVEQGGAMRASDITGVDRAVRAVQDLLASNPLRFHSKVASDEGLMRPSSFSGYLGRDLGVKDGVRSVVLTADGTRQLERLYGVTDQATSQAEFEGVAKRRKSTRIEGKVVHGTLWLVPADGGYDDTDDDTQPPHNPDPHNLKPRIPGAGVTSDATNTISSVHGTSQHVVGNAPEQSQPTVVASEPNFLEIFVPEFNWSNQLYELLPGESPESVSDGIVADSEVELTSLRIMARAWDIEVPDPPDNDDPRWLKIHAFGPEKARGIIVNCAESLTASQTASDEIDRKNYLSEYVRDYRLYLLARMRYPSWFVNDAHRS